MISRLFKERPRVREVMRVLGGSPKRPRFRGMRLPNGDPVPVDCIMEQFGVSREAAERIAQRQTR